MFFGDFLLIFIRFTLCLPFQMQCTSARAVGIIYHFDSQQEIVYKSLSTDYESYAF